MTDDITQVCAHVSDAALARLDALASAEGGTRSEVAARILTAALTDRDTPAERRGRAFALLDTDEDLAGP